MILTMTLYSHYMLSSMMRRMNRLLREVQEARSGGGWLSSTSSTINVNENNQKMAIAAEVYRDMNL